MKDYKNMPEAEECAIWQRVSKSGDTYLSGTVKFDGQDIKIVAFQNDKEGNEKRPDYSFKKNNTIDIV